MWMRVGEWLSGSVIIAVLLAMGCLATPADAQNVGILSGRVTNSQGQPVTVLVHLFAEGEIPAGSAYSDSNGSYVFIALPSGTYTVAVDAEGYKPFRQITRLEDNIQPRAQVMVMLEATTPQTVRKGPAIVGSKSRNEPDAKAAAPDIGHPKAVKEFDKGTRAERDGNSAAAIQHYQKALQFDASYYPALNNLGTIYERQGKHAQAEQAFLKALKINPNDGESYINLGHVLYEQGQYRPAIDRLTEGLQRSPQSVAGNFLLGSAYYKLHENEKAETLLKKACSLDPLHMAPARLQLANLYLQRHDYESARRQLQIFLQLNPKAPQAEAVKKTLADLSGQ